MDLLVSRLLSSILGLLEINFVYISLLQVPRRLDLLDLQKFGELWYQPRVKFNVPSGRPHISSHSTFPLTLVN